MGDRDGDDPDRDHLWRDLRWTATLVGAVVAFLGLVSWLGPAVAP